MMYIVFIGVKPFIGTDRLGYRYQFYQQKFKIGDIIKVTKHDMSEYLVENIYNYPIILPKENFITLEEWREEKLNDLGI